MDPAKLKEVCTRYQGSATEYHADPIPDSKARNARESLNIPSTERIFALIDCTVWGSAKESIVVGESGLYWKTGTGQPQSLSWSQLRHRTLSETYSAFTVKKITIDNRLKISLLGAKTLSKKRNHVVLQLLNDLKNLAESSGAIDDHATAIADRPAGARAIVLSHGEYDEKESDGYAPSGSGQPISSDRSALETEKMFKDPDLAAKGAGWKMGCGTFIVLGSIIGLLFPNMPGALAVLVLLFSIGMGFAARAEEKNTQEQKIALEEQKLTKFVAEQVAGKQYDRIEIDSKTSTPDTRILLMCRATYFGGHKKFGDIANVNIALQRKQLFIKALPGYPETTFEIPYSRISDFGLATQEQLTLTRLLLVGILAFALKKQEQYLYIKFTDQLGFENNPVFGGFVGANIASVSSEIYKLAEEAHLQAQK